MAIILTSLDKLPPAVKKEIRLYCSPKPQANAGTNVWEATVGEWVIKVEWILGGGKFVSVPGTYSDGIESFRRRK